VANTVPNSTRLVRVETPPVRTLGSAGRLARSRSDRGGEFRRRGTRSN